MQSHVNYFEFNHKHKILIIDDIDEHSLNDNNLEVFIDEIIEKFDFIFIFIDEVTKLSKQSTDFDYFDKFEKFRILEFGHRKRDELIRKCISKNEGEIFCHENDSHILKLDTDTKHINAVIGTNVVPSYPIFIITIFHTVESATPRDMSQTSYGHCYQAIITINLKKIGLMPENISSCFNFLSNFSFQLFSSGNKVISDIEFNTFIEKYQKEYILIPKIKEKLIRANIIISTNNGIKFQYIYIFYYFVGKYFADNLQKNELKNEVEKLLSNVDQKDNSNVIVFITHHSKNLDFLDEILLESMSVFDDYEESTLSDNSKNIVKSISDSIDHNKVTWLCMKLLFHIVFAVFIQA